MRVQPCGGIAAGFFSGFSTPPQFFCPLFLGQTEKKGSHLCGIESVRPNVQDAMTVLWTELYSRDSGHENCPLDPDRNVYL